MFMRCDVKILETSSKHISTSQLWLYSPKSYVFDTGISMISITLICVFPPVLLDINLIRSQEQQVVHSINHIGSSLSGSKGEFFLIPHSCGPGTVDLVAGKIGLLEGGSDDGVCDSGFEDA